MCCRCLQHVPDSVVDRIMAKDFNDSKSYERGLYVRCHLVACGSQPLEFMNHAIESMMGDLDNWYI